jgi:hypothetical protein
MGNQPAEGHTARGETEEEGARGASLSSSQRWYAGSVVGSVILVLHRISIERNRDGTTSGGRVRFTMERDHLLGEVAATFFILYCHLSAAP